MNEFICEPTFTAAGLVMATRGVPLKLTVSGSPGLIGSGTREMSCIVTFFSLAHVVNLEAAAAEQLSRAPTAFVIRIVVSVCVRKAAAGSISPRLRANAVTTTAAKMPQESEPVDQQSTNATSAVNPTGDIAAARISKL